MEPIQHGDDDLSRHLREEKENDEKNDDCQSAADISQYDACGLRRRARRAARRQRKNHVYWSAVGRLRWCGTTAVYAESKEDPQAEYTLFYDQIEGFEYEEGYEYELRVKEETVENPPADASSRKWTLVEVVSKTAVETAETETALEPQELQPSAEGEVITMYVGPELIECTGVAPQTCMQVKMNPDDNYTLFYNPIEGFTFEPGNEYELLVLSSSGRKSTG